jgi:ketosteroid isomerase-like protein/uncharacterized glyoxalase superfamily protein PhnB
MRDSPEVELLHRAFQALTNGDFAVLAEALAEDATWRTVEGGSTNCEGRRTIIEVMSRNLAGRLRGSVEETIQHGHRVIVGFRPERPSDAADRPLQGGIAYMVVTIADRKIIELQGCADRNAALGYAQCGKTTSGVATVGVQAPAGPATGGVQAPDVAVEPPPERVSRLVPFVKVTDVERAVAFYHHLGFTPQSVFKYRGRLSWAELESDGAEIMFEGTSDPIEPDRSGVLFYLYSHDLAALRDQLVAAGIEAGAIADGSPGPRQEMRVTDPDGYVLMVAQIE